MSSYRDLGTVDVGDRVRFRTTYRHPDTLAYIDPATVACRVWRDGDDDAEDALTVRDSLGKYDSFFVPVDAGRHYMEVVTTGEYAVVDKGQFVAEGSVLPPP
jgi:hypothetical protein